MANVLVEENSLKSIAQAIRAKNGSTDKYEPGDMATAISNIPSSGTLVSKTVTQNGTYDPANDNADGYSSVIVNVPSSAAAENDVNLIDYDGTILHSYTAAAFAELSALPANPSHTGLTAQGWNWSLSDAQAYVASYGKLWIGQVYDTSDGGCKVVVSIPPERTTIVFNFTLDGTATIDWGDQNTTTLTGTYDNASHTYATSGTYTISIALDGSGELSFNRSVITKYNPSYVHDDFEDTVYMDMAKEIFVGSNCEFNAWPGGSSVEHLTIPSSITSIDYAMFSEANTIQCIVLPGTVTSIGEEAFSGCSALAHVLIPNSVTEIGYNAFYECKSLRHVEIPTSVESVGSSAFSDCTGLESAIISAGAEEIGSYAFSGCTSLASVNIPSGVTEIGYGAFSGCSKLISVAIPSGLTTIGEDGFYNCPSLVLVNFPSSVAEIGSDAFGYCYGLKRITFNSSTPPTIGSNTTFSHVPTDCVIMVPTGTVSAYETATNLSSLNHTYIEF